MLQCARAAGHCGREACHGGTGCISLACRAAVSVARAAHCLWATPSPKRLGWWQRVHLDHWPSLAVSTATNCAPGRPLGCGVADSLRLADPPAACWLCFANSTTHPVHTTLHLTGGAGAAGVSSLASESCCGSRHTLGAGA